VRSDYQSGLDVDVVADAHDLHAAFGAESFDAVIAGSVFEHLRRPWIAAKSIAQVLTPGGHVLVLTHQTFIIHGHPSDYWRFTTEALRTLFEDAGMETVSAWYDTPCRILCPRPGVWRHAVSPRAKAYLNVGLIARRAGV
jgi:SAM-dependent methyltransferase